jgi:demethylmenaquinone methyltransferase/2-methoxy-6-polyprenyl-1,4-benzoquinol methylase
MINKDQGGHPLNNFYSKIYRRYDRINRIFTFGLDKKWRKISVRECFKSSPKNIIDLCCGTGDMTVEIAKQSESNTVIYGYDFNDKMLMVADEKLRKLGYKEIKLLQGDVAAMPFQNGEFECATIAFGFRNLTFENPTSDRNVLEISRIIKMKGRLVILESSVPSNKFIRFFYVFYLKLFLMPIGGLISGDWKAYKYLAYSSANYYTFEQIKNILLTTGFEVECKCSFFYGAASMISAIKTR